MKLLKYITTLLITVCLLICSLKLQQAIHRERALISDFQNLKSRVEILESQSPEYVTYEAIQPAMDDMAAHNEFVKQYSVKVDDMVLSYHNLDEVLKNMGYETQRQYEKLLKVRQGK